MASPRLRRLLTLPLVVVAATWLFVEEILWERLNQLLGWLGRLPVLRRVEAWIAGLPAYAALALFIVPALVLLPFKFAALWLIARGHVVTGMQMFILAKVTGTAMAARIFTLCRPTLMSKPWFARGYDWVIRMRDLVHGRIAETWTYRTIKAAMAAIRARIAAMRARRPAGGSLLRRFRALLRLRAWRNR
jgi:hypothetical protein